MAANMNLDVRSCFIRGRYSECVSLLKSTDVSRKLTTDEWARQQNLAVCQYLLQRCRPCPGPGSGDHGVSPAAAETDTSLTRRTTMLRAEKGEHLIAEKTLYSLLMQVKGVPLSLETLEIECALVYNLCYLNLVNEVSTTITQPRPSPSSSSFNLVLTTLNRACAYLGENASFTSLDETAYIGHLVTNILADKKRTGRLWQGVLLLGLIYGFNLMLQNKSCPQAVKLLESVYTNSKSAELSENLVVLALSNDHVPPLQAPAEGSKTWYQVAAQFLLATCHYCNANYQQCITDLEGDNGQLLDATKSYLKGCAHFQLKEYDQCVKQLESSRTSPDKKVQARAFNLTGSCLAEQKLPHSAIQHFKMSLESDFSHLQPIYNIALQYRVLGYHDAEIEMLSLATKAFEESAGCQSSRPLSIDVSDILCHQVSPAVPLTLPHVLYTLAVRCRDLGRYDTSAVKFMDLLALLSKASLPVTTDCEREISCLPTLQTIHHEAAYVLLKCGRYQDVVSVCDRVLDKYTATQCTQLKVGSQDRDPSPSTHQTETDTRTGVQTTGTSVSIGTSQGTMKFGLSRKRPRSGDSLCDVSEETGHEKLSCRQWDGEVFTGLEDDVVALKYKADGLMYLGDLSGSLTCLERLCAVLQPVLHESEGDLSNTTKPGSKRPRLESVGTDAVAPPIGEPVTSLLFQSCICCAVVLAGLDRTDRALYWSKCALQLFPEDLTASYTHCLLLLKLGKPDDIIVTWLQARGLAGQHMDGLQVDRLLQNKITQRRKSACQPSATIGGELSRDQLLAMDVVALQILQRKRLASVNHL